MYQVVVDEALLAEIARDASSMSGDDRLVRGLVEKAEHDLRLVEIGLKHGAEREEVMTGLEIVRNLHRLVLTPLPPETTS